jgi:carboxyl-terminal processing protease
MLLRFYLITLLLFTGSAGFALESSEGPLKFTDEQTRTLQEMIKSLERRHYASKTYDDNLSAIHLERFIDTLDPRKIYFTNQDVETFSRYSTLLDDQAENRSLDAAIEVYSVYYERRVARLSSFLEDMGAEVAKLDFDLNDYIELEADKLVWADTQEALQVRWRLQFKNDVLNLKLAKKTDEEIVKTLSKRYNYQLKEANRTTERDVFAVYANALASLYGPHTSYYSPRQSENFDIEMSLSLEGIGALLQLDEDYVKVSRIVPKGPADKHGQLKAADRIVGVGQGAAGEMVDVIGWRLSEVVDLIRGPKGTTVRLEIIPAKSFGSGETQVIEIVRNEVKLEEQAAQADVVEIQRDNRTYKIGVIDIPTFYMDFDAASRGDPNYRSTSRDVRRLLDELEAKKVDAVLIDLRNNGGGSLREANDLTGLFIDYGPTVQIKHSSGNIWRDGKRERGNYYTGPMGVIINRLSASASEIFAGAIQDYGRGLIIGNESFGKGTVQTFAALTEGQLKVTESKFYRISGDSTQHRGVTPDVLLPSLYDPEDIGESTMDFPLPWDQIRAVPRQSYGDYESLLPRLIASSQQRQLVEPRLVLLREQIELSNQDREQTRLSLNFAERQKAREERNARWLAIENKRRALEGEEPLLTLDQEEDSSDDMDEPEDRNAIDTEHDALLLESAQVITDALIFSQEPLLASPIIK